MSLRDLTTGAGRPGPEAPKPILNELSQLAFTVRIIEEAEDPANPFAERLRFVAIASANLQEYFMTHFARLDRSVSVGPSPDTGPRFRAPQVRRHVAEQTNVLRRRLAEVWSALSGPGLREHQIELRPWAALSEPKKRALAEWFEAELAPHLSPCPSPGAKLPSEAQALPWFAVLAAADAPGDADRSPTWLRAPANCPVLVESRDPGPPPDVRVFVDVAELVCALLPAHLLAGQTQTTRPPSSPTTRPRAGVELSPPNVSAVRVVRACDDHPDYDASLDPATAITAALDVRASAPVVRLEIDANAPSTIRRRLAQHLSVPLSDLVTLEPFRMAKACAQVLADQPAAHFPPLRPRMPAFATAAPADLFAAIATRDRLLHHPYDSFDAVLALIQAAASDPATRRLAITLYRIGTDTPVVELLAQAAARGVHVTAFVELRARFDEATNLELSAALRAHGVEVIHGPPQYKVHAKACLIERAEPDGPRRYVHLGTGNYHHRTGSSYSDLSLLSASPTLGADLAAFMATLADPAQAQPVRRSYRALLIAPAGLRAGLIERIDAVIAAQDRGQRCALSFKMNALVDDQMITRLYAASRAGVRVRLQVRGSCRLRPGIPGRSENIEVMSLIGRFLEHARLYHFAIGDDETMLSGSADLMPRNLDRRVELLFPITDPEHRATLRELVLDAPWRDTAKARRLRPDASYVRASPTTAAGQAPALDLQAALAGGDDWRTLSSSE